MFAHAGTIRDAVPVARRIEFAMRRDGMGKMGDDASRGHDGMVK